jgi:hypothetical protein
MSSLEDQQKDVYVTHSSHGSESSASNVDGAWKFLDDHREVAANSEPVDIDRLRRKIDWHIVPLMFCCYTMQFLDKVILNVSTHTPLSMMRRACA